MIAVIGNMGLKLKKLWIYAFIMVLQIIVILYWGKIKTNYYVDEFFSMGYASSFTEKGDTAKWINTSPDYKFNEWIENAALKKYLLLSDEEKVFNVSPITVIHKFITKGNYYGFLNIAESIAGYDSVTSKPGLFLNILFFVLAELSLISLMKKMGFDEKVSCLSLAMFGFSSYVLSTAEYIRFYMMVIMLTVMMLNALYRLWNATSWRGIILSEFAAFIIAYIAYKNSELMLAFFGAFVGFLFISSFLCKKRRLVVSTIVLSLLGVAYIAISTDFISVLLYTNSYDYVVGDALLYSCFNIVNSSLETVKNYLIWVKTLFETCYFGNYRIIYMLIGAATLLLVLANEKDGKMLSAFDIKRIRIREIRIGTVLAFACWGAIYLFARKCGQGVRVSLIVLLLIVLVGLAEAVGYKIRFQKISVSSDGMFVCILFGTAVIYTIFCGMCGYYGSWRYYCFGFTSFTITLWFIIDRVLKKSLFKEAKRPLLVVLAVFVVFNSLIPFKTRNIDFMYENEHEFISNVRNAQPLDVVLYTTTEDSAGRKRFLFQDLYDCVNLLPAEAKIYLVNLGVYEYEQVDYPDEFMLWWHVSIDMAAVLDDLALHGYEFVDLGADHGSHAYVCRLQERKGSQVYE